jgi:hypothetical protein
MRILPELPIIVPGLPIIGHQQATAVTEKSSFPKRCRTIDQPRT